MGGTGLEPVTPSLSIRGGRSLRFGEVRSEGMAERNPSVERTLERTRTNVERCHCCHAVRMFRRQRARPPETTPSDGEGDTGGAAARSCQRRRSGDQRTSAAEHGLLGMKRARIVAAVLLFGSMCALAIWLYDYRVWVVTGYREPYSFHGHRWFRYVETGRFLDQAWWSPYAALACFVTGACSRRRYRPTGRASQRACFYRSCAPLARPVHASCSDRGDRSRNET